EIAKTKNADVTAGQKDAAERNIDGTPPSIRQKVVGE
ncbi:hypothetical protein ACIGJK_27610, partial [Pseudomonas iridis]